MSDDKLLICPFCGANQNIDHEYADYEISPNLQAARKTCWKCGASGPSAFFDDYETDEEWLAAAYSKWNDRVGFDPIQASIDTFMGGLKKEYGL